MIDKSLQALRLQQMVVRGRIRTASLHEVCQGLFSDYPLAERAVDYSGAIHSMVLMLREDEDVRFFVLSRGCGDASFRYSLCPWPVGDVVDIETEGSGPVPDVIVRTLAHGVPLPRHGSIFGWTERDTVTALVVIYTEYEPARPLPRWTVMPLVGTPCQDWPPFTSKRFFGNWFWEYYRAGSLVSLDGVIAESANTVFWVNTRAILGSDCCVVARNVSGRAHYTLRRGCYVYSEALRAGKRVPSLAQLLADTGKVDLAHRFQRSLSELGGAYE